MANFELGAESARNNPTLQPLPRSDARDRVAAGDLVSVPPISPSYLALEVSRFLRKHDIPRSRFGREAVGDPRLVTDLFNGRIVRQATADKVRAYMAGRA